MSEMKIKEFHQKKNKKMEDKKEILKKSKKDEDIASLSSDSFPCFFFVCK